MMITIASFLKLFSSLLSFSSIDRLNKFAFLADVEHFFSYGYYFKRLALLLFLFFEAIDDYGAA